MTRKLGAYLEFVLLLAFLLELLLALDHSCDLLVLAVLAAHCSTHGGETFTSHSLLSHTSCNRCLVVFLVCFVVFLLRFVNFN